MLKLSDLAHRPDLQLGSLLVSPSRRLVQGPAGQAHVEPLTMQALLLLLEARGSVVTRTELFETCWGGAAVGDDSLNRTIAMVRRILSQTAPGSAEIETIPRTGYRLTGEIISPGKVNGEARDVAPQVSRRAAIAGGGLIAAAAGGLGLWSLSRSRADHQFDGLVNRGRQELNYGDPSSRATEVLQRAIFMRPDDASAQGLYALALSQVAENGDAQQAAAAVRDAEQAARAALAVNSLEPNARLALILLQRSALDIEATENSLRKILALAPNNIYAMRQLWDLLQSAGRSRDALALVERANAIEPLAAGNHYPRAQLLWILGRNAEAERVIERAMQYWPSHRFVRFARFTIFAFTGRPRAALAMLDTKETAPQHFTPAAISLWRVSLPALENRSPTQVAIVRKANVEAVKQTPGLARQAVLVLSALGEVDAAFEIANQMLVFRPFSPSRLEHASRGPSTRPAGWRFTPWLFTPPVASLRADPRFNSLCDGIGLSDYWRKRGVKPDYQLGIT